MTEELRQRANVLHKQLTDLGAQIAIVEDMHHCDNCIIITCNSIGSITIPDDSELKDDIIDLILSKLNERKGEVEDEYREL